MMDRPPRTVIGETSQPASVQSSTPLLKRDFAGASLTRYFERHEIKGGLEYEREQAEVVRRFSGGQQVDVFANAANPSRPIYLHSYWTTPTATLADAPVSQLTASPEHKNTTAYLQNRWTVLPNITVSLGVRWNRQEIIDAEGTQQIDLKKDYAPRIYGRYEFFLTLRGAEGRTPDNYEADLHLGYPLTVGPATINVLVDVFNLLDVQKAVMVDERWDFQQADNASPTPTNPSYGKPVLRTPPRSYRLGLRLSF